MDAQSFRVLEAKLVAAEEKFFSDGLLGAMAFEISTDLRRLIEKVVCARIRAETGALDP